MTMGDDIEPGYIWGYIYTQIIIGLMIRILIVHPTQLIASVLKTVLSEEPDIDVVGQAHTVAEAIQMVQTIHCHIVLAAATLPDNGALQLTQTLTESHPHLKVLIVGVPKTKQIILQYVMAGASGYVLQEVSVDHLFDNIRAAYEDKALISPSIAAAFMSQLAELAHISAHTAIQPSALHALTPREVEVLKLIDTGLTNQAIADQLVIEIGTVKNHVHNILNKLEVNSREEAAAHLPYLEDTDNGK